jgi:hypothetical protein
MSLIPPSRRALAALALALSAGLVNAAVVIQPSYDVSFTSNPNFTTLKSTVESAIAIYSSSLADNLTIPITFKLDNAISGAQSSYAVVNYSFSSYLAKLQAVQSGANDATVVANLGAGPNDPVLNAANISVPQALAFALGLGSAPASYGSVTFNQTTYQSNPAGFLGVIQHEVNEVLGTSSNLPNGGGALPATIMPADLFRYTAAGARTFTTNGGSDPNNKAYFRISPFGSNLQEWNNLPNGGDYGDWAANGSFPAAPQDNTGDSNTFTSMSQSNAELQLLDAIGYNLNPVPEPGEWAMATGVALVGFAGFRRLRRRTR